MILVADSGATKTDWVALEEGREKSRFKCGGCNPNYSSSEEMKGEIAASFPLGFSPSEVVSVFFYGSGISDLRKPQIKTVLHELFPLAGDIEAESDLLGAARALLGHRAGFAAILGTGANSCIYDGEKIVQRVPSLGFILGDEGSGAYLGRLLIRDFLRGNTPPPLTSELSSRPGMGADELIYRIYSAPKPSSFCASFCKDLLAMRGRDTQTDDYIGSIVRQGFTDFFNAIVSHYPNYRSYSFNCIGSAGYLFRDILGEVAISYGMSVGSILRAPLDGLIEFHK